MTTTPLPSWRSLFDDGVREPFVSSSLGPFVLRQRWFAGKARTVAGVKLADWSKPEASLDRLRFAIVEVDYADGDSEQYFVPVAHVPAADAAGSELRAPDAGHIAHLRDGRVIDAASDDASCRAILGMMLGRPAIAMQAADLHASTYRAAPARVESLPVSRHGGEQSNSSVTFGTACVMKLLRRLEPGPHPELEMGRFLISHGFTRIPAPLAGLDRRTGDGLSTTLALVQTFVANQGTAWDQATSDVRRCFALAAERPVVEIPRTVGADRPPLVAEVIGFLSAAATLGQRTAELHRALASDADDPAFAPEILRAPDVAATTARMQQEAARALTLLDQQLLSLPKPARARGQLVLGRRSALLTTLEGFGAAPAGLARTRVHGDYHLGQVLWTGTDAVLIDFEGEPARPIDERRAKHSPLKDVAGMLRSFSYAAYATLLREAGEDADQLERLEPWARMWEAWTSYAFLEAYRRTAADSPGVPSNPNAFSLLLDAFVLEKALYELVYELGSRPIWVQIPLIGITRLLGGADLGPTSS